MMPVIIPPNTPVSMVCIPKTILCPDSAKLFLAKVSVIVNRPFIEAFIIKKPNIAAKPAVPLSLLANPNATPIANMTGKLANTILPALDISTKIFCKNITSNNG